MARITPIKAAQRSRRAQWAVRLYDAKPSRRLRGAELFCPRAQHMAHLLALAINRDETAASLLVMPFYHPTLEEGSKPALRAICKTSTKALQNEQDTGDPFGA
ncbi:hypothetical protein [Yoonia sp. MH D7]